MSGAGRAPLAISQAGENDLSIITGGELTQIGGDGCEFGLLLGLYAFKNDITHAVRMLRVGWKSP